MKEKIFANMNRYENSLSAFACKNSAAIRLKENSEDMRPAFFRDVDRIIYSLSYTRYTDKTQVFTFNENNNITRRMTHVQLVSKIARTIGRALGLNEDLIEAAALGHDLGHVPFGHVGELILNRLSLEHNAGYFNHNIQSVRNLMFVENNGEGRNLTFQVLDAIMCHNGEFVLGEYYPKKKNIAEFLLEYENSYHDETITKKLVPATLEGCVVRISDVIAYVGKDIEDAVRLGLLTVKEIPANIASLLGNNNHDIVNTIVTDVIENSLDKPYIKMSAKIYNALKDLKEFNYQHIYAKANSEEDLKLYEKIFRKVFTECLKDLENNTDKTLIHESFLNDKIATYLTGTTRERQVIDYIAGMTDDYIYRIYNLVNNN